MSPTDNAGNTDELRFDDAVPPDSVAGPLDAAPATDDVLSCQTCGKTLSYSGRGRKPKYCDEHKRGSSGSVTPRRIATPNDKLATQATEALIQINRLTGLGARMLGLEHTQEMIMFGEEGFRAQAYEALLTDPALCKQILAAGSVSGKFSLAVAYAMLGGQVAPVAYMELKAKQAAKEKATESALEKEYGYTE